jgi:hypothetical protein
MGSRRRAKTIQKRFAARTENPMSLHFCSKNSKLKVISWKSTLLMEETDQIAS